MRGLIKSCIRTCGAYMNKERMEAIMDELDHRVELLMLSKEQLVQKIILLEKAFSELMDQISKYEN